MRLGEGIVVPSTYLHMSLGPGRCSVPSEHLVIVQIEQHEMNTLTLLFSGPLGPHRASCLQRALAAQGPSLRPERLHLFLCQLLGHSPELDRKSLLDNDDIRTAFLPQAKLCFGVSKGTSPPIGL